IVVLTSPRPSNSCTVRMSWLSSNKCGANEARHGQRTEELHDLDCSHLRRVALAVKYDVPANAGHTRLLGASAAMASAQYFAQPVRTSDGTLCDTEPTPRRGQDHEVRHKGPAS